MRKKKSNIEKASEILMNYSGDNNVILYFKKKFEEGRLLLSEDGFDTEYIIKNCDYKKVAVNKIVKISSILGKSLQEKYEIDFQPEKLLIKEIIGEMGKSYHCYCQYRKSVPPKLMYIRKRYILDELFKVDHEKLKIDFEKYDKITEKYGRKLKEHQKTGVKFLVANKKCILADSMGLGKLQPLSSLIATPTGFKTMGEINIGDKVFGSNGKPCNVLNIYPHENKEIYRVTFTDGTFAECGLEHLWTVRTPNHKKRNQGWKIMSLKEIVEQGLEWSNGKSKYHVYKFEIPITEPLEYEEKDHFINPYILGMCIGDGNMCNGGVRISIPDTEIESVSRISGLLNENYTLHKNASGVCPRYTIRKKIKSNSENLYNTEIKRLGLNVHGNFKFIPEEYKYDSIKNRLELLRGLMDSDGSIKNGNKIGYYTNSERLAEDVVELVTSLGGVARKRVYKRTKNNKEVVEYHVPIQIKVNPFNLERKKDKYSPTFKKYCIRKICKVEYIRNEDAKCILVDSPDHTYITGKEHIVTHNTTQAVVAALETGCKKILVITTAALKSTWKREIGFYEPNENIFVVNGSKWDGETAKFTVINYDIVKNYYEVPMEQAYEEQILTNSDGEIEKVRVPVYKVNKKTGKREPKMVKSRKKVNVQKNLENSPLFQSGFDCVIIDEAQKLSNNTSNRYKVIYDFLMKSNIEYVFLTTGTPLTNTPMNLYHILKLIDASITSEYEFYVQRYCDGKEINKPGEFQKWSNVADARGKTGKEKYDFIGENVAKMIIPQGASNLDELRERIKHLYIRRLSSDIPGMVNKRIETLEYDLNSEQKKQYDKLWEEYLEAQEENGDESNEEYRQLVEGMLVRQFLANEMVENTKKLVDDYIEDGEKVIIVCNFTNELEQFKEYYGKQCVTYDGKMTAKQKDKAVDAFMNDKKVKVFIGQEVAMSVGLTLTSSHIMVFNSYSWSENDNRQTQDRIYRITQTEDALCIYQLFTDSISKDMFEKVMRKGLIMDETIKSENDK